MNDLAPLREPLVRAVAALTDALAALDALRSAAPAPAPAPTPAPTPTLADVNRAVIALYNACGRASVVELLARFGAEKASSLRPEQYAAAIAAATEGAA